jgi:hypothetical protein
VRTRGYPLFGTFSAVNTIMLCFCVRCIEFICGKDPLLDEVCLRHGVRPVFYLLQKGIAVFVYIKKEGVFV